MMESLLDLFGEKGGGALLLLAILVGGALLLLKSYLMGEKGGESNRPILFLLGVLISFGLVLSMHLAPQAVQSNLGAAVPYLIIACSLFAGGMLLVALFRCSRYGLIAGLWALVLLGLHLPPLEPKSWSDLVERAPVAAIELLEGGEDFR